ncbi:zinc knuckle CX2CX4HX4C containing protein [Tanacetum coccineum]
MPILVHLVFTDGEASLLEVAERMNMLMGTKDPAIASLSHMATRSSVPDTTNVVDLFGVPLNTLGDIDKLTKDIELGKYELWSDLPSDKCTKVMDTICAMWDAFVDENLNVTSAYSSDLGKSEQLESRVKGSTNIDDTIHVDESSIVQSVIVQDMPNSYVGLEDVLENGPWLIRNSPIILKKLTMNMRLCKEEITCIPVWVKIQDVPIQNQPLKAIVPSTKEGSITMSNSYDALDDQSNEDVENVYDESANLLHSLKTGGSSSTFTAAAG